ncbi:cytochrome c oxidase subunit NDUFA4 [Galendromus occidentalis]|uniref:Cytochrome c oxidase subunit NDUFA4 n=1 Tax=Galendromus occidentalis TaxID=34638 RepID=A0AAJ6QR00_9ACAR|nr:cytochrome c oxidase subunit NDUFA4 [Galendromus occidentalis]
MVLGLKSLSIAGMKQHPSLIPLLACLFVGCSGAALYTARLALKSPDVSWNKQKNAEPWQEYENKQYKFISSRDYSSLPQERPKF